MPTYIHGGDIWAYSRPMLDFSANLHPLGMPPAVAEAARSSVADAVHYPDPLCRALRGAIARRDGVPPEQVLCGGGAADLMELLQVGGVILCAMVFVTVGNLGCLFGFGKLFKWNWEELCNASCATIGGPTTAAAFSINKGWNALIVPGILIGLWGYAIGSYVGILCGNIFS